MKGLLPLFLGLFGTFAFSWIGLTVIPNWQIGHLDPQMDEEGTDIYPMPKSGMADRGRRVYTGNGCFYCHSQQVRADYAGSDIDRKWGERRSAPRDYIFAKPAELGKMRMGPDLSNIGKRAPAEDQNAPPAGASPAGSPAANAAPAGSPAAASPAPAGPQPSVTAKPGASPAAASPTPAKSTSSPAGNASPAAPPVAAKPNASPPPAPSPATSPAPGQSASPAASAAAAAGSLDSAPANGEPLPYSAAWHHKHLYSPRSISLDSNMPAYRFLYEKRRISGEPSADALKLTDRDTPPEGWEIVPTYEAKALVAYLMSLDQSHPLKEVKSGAPPAAAASPAPAAASPAPPPK
ncbi:MAG: cytochrome c oxidase cbb3-type subunit [Verrucomicrobiota bacterium]|jgi:cytochrome c oxidase cbb3-type subunit 2